MNHSVFFREAAKSGQQSLDFFEAVVDECASFVGEALSRKLIDRFEPERAEKINYRLHTFKIVGPMSDVRYSNRSILSSAWTDIDNTKKGVVEPRRKLVDYYLRIRQERETGLISVEFTVMGFAQHAKKMGQAEPISLIKLDKRTTNPFFAKVAHTMTGLKPIIEAHAGKYQRKLERLPQ